MVNTMRVHILVWVSDRRTKIKERKYKVSTISQNGLRADQFRISMTRICDLTRSLWQYDPESVTVITVKSRAQFHGSAYRMHRIGAYGSREFCANSKPISPFSGKFWRLRVRTPRYYRHSTLTRLAQKFGACT